MTEILHFSQIDPEVLKMQKVRGVFLDWLRESEDPEQKVAIAEMILDTFIREGELMNRAQARQIVAELQSLKNPEICKN